MPVFIVPGHIAVLLIFLLWFIIHMVAALIARAVPDAYYRGDAYLFKERAWEQGGRIYEQYFKVKRWKEYLPDGAAFFRQGHEKKRLTDVSVAHLERFLIESRRAELTHVLGILPFWIFGLFVSPLVLFIMFVYAVLVNVPCLIAQRYNRPRIARIIARKQQRATPELQ